MKMIGKDHRGVDAEWVRSSHHTMCRMQRRQELPVDQECLPAIGVEGEEIRCTGNRGAKIP